MRAEDREVLIALADLANVPDEQAVWLANEIGKRFTLIPRDPKPKQDGLWDQTFDEDTVGRTHGHDPVTSRMAAKRQAVTSGTNRFRVLEFLRSCGVRGATGYEIGRNLNMLRTAADTRRKELAEVGLVETRPNVLRPTDTGSPAQVHVITENGLAALSELERRRATGEAKPTWKSRDDSALG